MTSLLALASGLALVGGMALLLFGLRRTQPTPATRRTRRWTVPRWRPRSRRHGVVAALAVLLGVVVAVATGWVLWVVLVPLLLLGLPVLLSEPKNRELALLEAMDRWVRSLASMLPTGLSVLDAIRASNRNAPPLLTGPLALMTARLDARWTAREALLGFADELADPDTDATVAALILAAERGGTGATATLTELADSLQSRLRAFREIEAERSKPRIVVRQVTVVTVLFISAALLLGGSFFEPYRTVVGQLILAVLLACYAGSLIMLRRMTVPRQRARILMADPS